MHLASSKLTSPLNQPSNEKTSSAQQQSIAITVYSVSVGDALACLATVVVRWAGEEGNKEFFVHISTQFILNK